MPYTADTAPDAIKALPGHARDIWIAAYNAAHKQYGGDESKAAATAWAAVKKKYHKAGDRWVANKARVVLTLEAHGEAPEWIRILPLGEVKLTDEREPFHVTESSIALMMERFQARGNDLVIDYEHQTMGGGEAPAAGWIRELEARDDGLWARVEWTKKALGYLGEREYRYFSPVVNLHAETREVEELLNAALTNFPAMANLTPLVMRYGEDLMAAESFAVTDADRDAQKGRAKRHGIGVKEGGAITKPGQWSSVPDSQWGDPVNYRYPMPDAAHARNALARWGNPDNRKQYSSEEQSIIEQRIRRRAAALGIKTSKQKEAKPMLEKLIVMLGLDSETDEAEALMAMKTMKADFEAAKEQTEKLEADLEAAKAAKKEADQRAMEAEHLAGKIQVPITLSRALGLEPHAETSRLVTTIEALKLDVESGRLARQQLKEFKDQWAVEQAESLVDRAIMSGRTTHEELERNGAAIRKLAKDNSELFKTLIMARPEYSEVPLEKLSPPEKTVSDDDPGKPAHEILAAKAAEIAKSEKIDPAEATRRAWADNPELVARWSTEAIEAMGKK